MTKITQTITIELPDMAHFDVYLTENDYTGEKPLIDENGSQVFDEAGQPIMVEVTKKEYNNFLTKQALMALVDNATRRKQEKVGSLQYNASAINNAMENLIKIETIIE